MGRPFPTGGRSGEMQRMRPDVRGFVVSASFALIFLALTALVVYFYWSLGLAIDVVQWRNSLLPISLVLIGVFTVLFASWSYSSAIFGNSKMFTRFLAHTSLGSQLFSMFLGLDVVSATYLLSNLLLSRSGLLSYFLPICSWQDCVFYAFVLSQLASSFCAALVAVLVKYLA